MAILVKLPKWGLTMESATITEWLCAEGSIVHAGDPLFVAETDKAAHDVAALDEDGWFRTGDLGEVDADGNVRVTGRLKDVIIRNAENISAAEIFRGARAITRQIVRVGPQIQTLLLGGPIPFLGIGTLAGLGAIISAAASGAEHRFPCIRIIPVACLCAGYAQRDDDK